MAGIQDATYQRDQIAAFYERQKHEAAALERAEESHAMALRGEQRALQQWEESREDRAQNNARADRTERRAIGQYEESRSYQARQEWRAMESHDWHRESHDLTMRRERERLENEARARQLAHARFADPRASGLLGNARFADLDDVSRLGMLDSAGLFLGLLNDKGLYYNGDRHLTTYAGTRSGKGRNLVLQNLARYTGRSVIVSDVKQGENAYSSAHHRAHNLKQRIITLNPKGLHGLPSVRINPLDPVINAADEDRFDKAYGIASVLAPVVNAEERNAWVNQGASLVLQCVIAHMAKTAPEQCTPGGLWRYFTRDAKSLRKQFLELKDSPLGSVAGHVLQIMDWMTSPDQWNAYSSAFGQALRGFTPESPYTRATDATDFDPRIITQEACTVYLMMPDDDLRLKGHWVALLVNHLIRTVAAHPGPVRTLFMLDEFTQLPPIPKVLDSINLHAGKGAQFWIFAQDRQSLARIYGETGAGQFERQSGITQAWQMRDIALMKDYEYIGGRTSVNIINANMSDGGQVGTGLTLSEQTRPLLQPENFRQVAEDVQYLIPHQGPIIKARLWPWDRTAGNRQVLRDPRDALLGHILPPLPLPILTAAEQQESSV